MVNFMRVLCLSVLAIVLAATAMAQAPGNLRGIVTDPSGAAVPKASVTVTGPNGLVKVVETGNNGGYTIQGLPPGMYIIRISAPGFNLGESSSLELGSGRLLTADIKLSVANEKQEVTVTDQVQVELDPSKNAGATVLTGQDLEMLSDDPDDLQSDLQALAGPSAGPNGGQIFVDGFSNGQLPPKNSIREIRVNSNPFAAEFDRIGFGRVEILTKPGTDKLRGSMFYQADTAKLDARNPYSTSKPSFLTQQFQGNLSGAINKKSSFFFDFNRRNQDDQALIKATIPEPSVDSSLGIPAAGLNCDPITKACNYNQFVGTPTTRTSLSPRLDYQLGSSNTLQARYTWTRAHSDNTGVGGFSLASQGITNETTTQSAQLTETWVVNTTTINESRFQYTKTNNVQDSLSKSPTILVSGSFTGGAATQGPQFTNTNSYEFQNYTSMTRGAHFIKGGMRVRGTLEGDKNDNNFNGIFSFRTLADYLNTLNGTPSWFQYRVATGTALSSVQQVDIAPFIQDDWKVKPSITVSLGLRYEWQTNISDKGNVAPRVGLAWGIGGGQGRLRQPKTVIRAGFGIFYDRFGLGQVLNAERLNGVVQQSYVLSAPAITPYFGFTNIPSTAALASQASPQSIYRIDPNVVAPRILQSAIGIDRQLPKNITLSLNYTNSRGVHQLRTRNINAPLNGVFPAGLNHNPLDQYESSGLMKQSQITANVNARLNAKYTMFGFYNYGRASSNTDGVGTFPVNSYDLSTEWSRAQYDVRHRFLIGGNLAAPMGVRLNPFVMFNSAAPFNITSGSDLNGDSIANDRPSLATAEDISASDCLSKLTTVPCVVNTSYGPLNIKPQAGENPIPRNFGVGFGSFNVNMRVSRAWGFGEPAGGSTNAQAQPGGGPGGPGGGFGGPRGPGGGGGGGGGGRGQGGPFGGGASTNRRYNMTLSVEFRNLLNSVNPGTPVGIASSPTFGQSQGVAGGFGGGGGGGFGGGGSQSANRRLELQLRFNF